MGVSLTPDPPFFGGVEVEKQRPRSCPKSSGNGLSGDPHVAEEGDGMDAGGGMGQTFSSRGG